jgi:predicted amidophosphoribosyltransferase
LPFTINWATSPSRKPPTDSADEPFFPAMSAMRYNPICKEFAARLKAQGKPQIVIIGAIMNKLLHIIYGVLKHQKPFDPEYLKKHEKSA